MAIWFRTTSGNFYRVNEESIDYEVLRSWIAEDRTIFCKHYPHGKDETTRPDTAEAALRRAADLLRPFDNIHEIHAFLVALAQPATPARSVYVVASKIEAYWEGT